MPHLIACIGPDKDSWDVVSKIINSQVFDIIYIVTDINGENAFRINIPKAVVVSYILIDADAPVEDINEELVLSLKKAFGKDRMTDLDIAVNISSGSGKLHAALLSALMKLGYGIRIVEMDKEGDVVAL